MAAKTDVLSGQQMLVRQAVDALAKLGGSFITEDSIKRGPELVVPESMTLPEVAKFCLQKEEESREMVEARYEFPYRAFDGAVALERAIRKAFGTIKHVGTMGFFGPNPPRYLDIQVGPGEHLQVPWGALEVPAIPGCSMEMQGEANPELGEVFVVYATVRRSHRAALEGLMALVREELKANSIYKGKAIDGAFNFLDLSKVDRARTVYAESALRELETHILGPIRHGQVLKDAMVELKSAVLLHGTYGVGKTLFGYIAAQEAQEHGLTFIQVRPGQDELTEALRIARQYSPAVIFVEDVDLLSSPEAGRDVVEVMLEQFDGLRAKGVEVMAILTTNHPERIHKGMVRPGRIDAVIELTTPDAAGVVKLCKALVPAGLLAEITDEEWKEVGEAGLGYIPAFIHEACKRAIKYTVVRNGGTLEDGSITADDLASALDGLRPQWAMMNEASEDIRRHHLDEMLTGLVTESLDTAILAFARRNDWRLTEDKE